MRGQLPFRMLAPSKLALLITWVIWRRSDLKSESSAVREAVSSDGSIAADHLLLHLHQQVGDRSAPAVEATSAIEVARSRLIFTAPSAPMSARCPWAMAQTAALSLALLIFRPVLMRFWTSPQLAVGLVQVLQRDQRGFVGVYAHRHRTSSPQLGPSDDSAVASRLECSTAS